ncbi:MAG: hypothetical protein A3J88_08370, partial [Melioribacter sp. RIFOXYB12_FULL_38_5]
MRLKKEIIEFLKQKKNELFPENTKIYLFGSRTKDSLKGGDIDILILSEKKLPNNLIRKLRTSFYKKFGWQKIDIVNFSFF